jgi:predicted dehydrogenase
MGKTSLLIVGLTRGGAWARDIPKTTDLEIAGLVELDKDKLDRVATDLDVPQARRFTDFNRALDTDADIVVTATPTPLHKELSLAALRAGHDVICEKPFASSLEEARLFRDAINSSSQRFMIGHTTIASSISLPVR